MKIKSFQNESVAFFEPKINKRISLWELYGKKQVKQNVAYYWQIW